MKRTHGSAVEIDPCVSGGGAFLLGFRRLLALSFLSYTALFWSAQSGRVFCSLLV